MRRVVPTMRKTKNTSVTAIVMCAWQCTVSTPLWLESYVATVSNFVWVSRTGKMNSEKIIMLQSLRNVCKYQWLFSDPVTTANACARRWVFEADFHRRAKQILCYGVPR